MATFQDRLNAAMGERGYGTVMRRNVQTVILYEAHRCLKDKLPSLRPFQKKLAVFDQANFLLNETPLMPHQREEVMYKTARSKELLNPETMWKRVRMVLKEVEKVAEQVRPLCTKDKTHLEVYHAFLQKTYNETQGKNGELYPPRWEFTHNHNFLAYKMYYNKGVIDDTFPPPQAREIVVPANKPVGGLENYGVVRTVAQPLPPPTANDPRPVVPAMEGGGNPSSNGTTTAPHVVGTGNAMGTAGVGPNYFEWNPSTLAASAYAAGSGRNNLGTVGDGGDGGPFNVPPEKRREILQEVRDHMELLRSFEGIVDETVLRRRKLELFHAMPPVPPPIHPIMMMNRGGGRMVIPASLPLQRPLGVAAAVPAPGASRAQGDRGGSSRRSATSLVQDEVAASPIIPPTHAAPAAATLGAEEEGEDQSPPRKMPRLDTEMNVDDEDDDDDD